MLFSQTGALQSIISSLREYYNFNCSYVWNLQFFSSEYRKPEKRLNHWPEVSFLLLRKTNRKTQHWQINRLLPKRDIIHIYMWIYTLNRFTFYLYYYLVVTHMRWKMEKEIYIHIYTHTHLHYICIYTHKHIYGRHIYFGIKRAFIKKCFPLILTLIAISNFTFW